jgi:glycosyltransferase involved in cell wall biosynthesis
MADKIGCMSEGNIQYIRRHNPGISLNKLHILANWADMIPLKDKSDLEDLKKSEGIEGKFAVVFGGNVGLPQKMVNVIDLAKACVDQEDIVFLIYGYGSEIGKFKNLVSEAGVSNIILKDPISQHEFINLLQFADVGLISLSENFTIPNIPSKALAYYNARIPILASIDLNTDFGEILEKYNTGLWAEAGNTLELKSKLMALYHDPALRKKMGENGYQYMMDELSCEKAYQILMSEVNK